MADPVIRLTAKDDTASAFDSVKKRMTDVAKGGGAVTGASEKALAGTAKTARELQFALRGVPAQFTDIATSLASGQKPMLVFLQQGGQLKDMFGGIGPAASALGGYVRGLINPFTLAAGAAAALAFAYSQGSKEADAYNSAIILSGNAAGVTAGQLQSMAKSIDGIVGTQAAAADAVAQFAANGNIAGQSIERFALVAVKMEREAGQAVTDTVKQFAELAKEPVAASIKLNETTRHLTLSVYQQIKSLDEQGRMADAAALAQKAYADAMESRTGQIESRLGAVERAWRGVNGAAKEAWDSMLSVGRPDSMQDQLAAAQATLAARLERGGPRRGTLTSQAAFDAGNENLQRQIAGLQSRIAGENTLAVATKKAADQVRARIEWDKEGDKHLSNRVKMEREIAKARELGATAGASQAEMDKRIGAIRAKYVDKGASKAPRQIDTAQLNADLSAIKAAGEQMTSTYARSERTIEALRSAGMLSDREYYDSKRALLALESNAEEDALRKTIARLGQEKLAGKDKIDNDRKIAEAQAKLAILRADSAAKQSDLSIQEAAANTKVEQSFLNAAAAAQAYLDTIARQSARDLDGMGKGSLRREQDALRNQRDDQFQGRRDGLDQDLRTKQITQPQYDTFLQIEESAHQRALANDTAYWAEKLRKQTDWSRGASEALQNYLDESNNVAAQSADAFTSAFRGMEDAMVAFTVKGKHDFRSLVDSIIADLMRMTVRQHITGPLAAMMQGMLPASGAGVVTGGSGIRPGAGGSGMKLHSAATGTNRVPYDDFLTLLHKDEAVVPAKYNPAVGGGGGTRIVIENHGAQITERRSRASDGSEEVRLIVDAAKQAVAADIAGGGGAVSSALKSRGLSLSGGLARRG